MLAVTVREIAETMAAEWEAQRGVINPMTMPLTRLANSIIDGVTGRVDVVIEDIAKYLETDLLFYRAGHPDALVAREAAHWDRVLFWAAETLEARFILTEGIVHVRQPDQAVAAARKALPSETLGGWGAACRDDVDRLRAARSRFNGRAAGCGRGLGRRPRRRGLEQRAMRGVDEEAAVQRASRLVDFRAAAAVLRAPAGPIG